MYLHEYFDPWISGQNHGTFSRGFPSNPQRWPDFSNGCISDTLSAQDLWSPQEVSLHINVLDLGSICRAWETFMPIIKNQVVQIKNCCHVLSQQAKGWDIHSVTSGGNPPVELVHQELSLPESFPSPRSEKNHYGLFQQEFCKPMCVVHQKGHSSPDLPAVRGSNNRFVCYWLEQQILEVLLQDSLQSGFHVRCLSPPTVLSSAICIPSSSSTSRVIGKLRRDQARLILIAPAWLRPCWFTGLHQLSMKPPIILPLLKNLRIRVCLCTPLFNLSTSLYGWPLVKHSWKPVLQRCPDHPGK